MAENPLLPDRKLQELYALMQRCRALDRKAAGGATGRAVERRHVAREAWLAATTMHLQPGDLLCAEPGDSTAGQLAPVGTPTEEAAAKSTASGEGLFAAPEGSARLLMCAAAAGALKAVGREGIVLAFASMGSTTGPARAGNAGWIQTLEWAQRSQLPLLVACMDAKAGRGVVRGRGGRAQTTAEAPLGWESMHGLAQRLKLPVLPVDAGDAVAVYRAMQESALRARMGGGPAVLWAVMAARAGAAASASEPSERASQPLARLRSYLKTRGITLP